VLERVCWRGCVGEGVVVGVVVYGGTCCYVYIRISEFLEYSYFDSAGCRSSNIQLPMQQYFLRNLLLLFYTTTSAYKTRNPKYQRNLTVPSPRFQDLIYNPPPVHPALPQTSPYRPADLRAASSISRISHHSP
jgi:hypothetical protein